MFLTVFPNGNNYQEFRGAITENFASETGLQLTALIVWGIDGIDRDGTEPTDIDDIGKPVYADNISFYRPEEQQYIASVCDDLLCVYSDYSCRYAESTYYDLYISNPADYGGRERVVKCFMTAFREWVLTDNAARPSHTMIIALRDKYGAGGPYENVTVADFANCTYGEFPVVGSLCFTMLFNWIWVNDEMATSNPDYVAGQTNYDYYKEQIWIKEDEDDTLELKFIKISALTEATPNLDFATGIDLFNDWQTYADNWKNNVNGQNDVDQYGEPFVDTPDSLESIIA